ncbi:hypothetical protein DL93DRAFT_1491721 [Clavulina sp. PMI_390]|nr:hypothetical protein DL93DRAFT_1491721 [Clavulina sp. PMI_390]
MSTFFLWARQVCRQWRSLIEESLTLQYYVWCGIYGVSPFTEDCNPRVPISERLSRLLRHEEARRTPLNLDDDKWEPFGSSSAAGEPRLLLRRDTVRETAGRFPLVALPERIPSTYLSSPFAHCALVGHQDSGAPPRIIDMPACADDGESWEPDLSYHNPTPLFMVGDDPFNEAVDLDLDLFIVSDFDLDNQYILRFQSLSNPEETHPLAQVSPLVVMASCNLQMRDSLTIDGDGRFVSCVAKFVDSIEAVTAPGTPRLDRQYLLIWDWKSGELFCVCPNARSF